ncbi:MAG: efflux RND transporter periplasmic adaptor subunit [Puniceicoccales bacterium]
MVKVHVDDNQWVDAGDLLFEIDPTDYEKTVNRAKAALEKSKTVAANLKLEVERRRGLVASKLISLEEFQRFEAQYLEAVADISLDEADLDLAKLNLSYTRVRAPVSGYITNLQVTDGTYVFTGQSLMALVDAGSFWISAYFKETDLQTIQPGDRVRIIMMGDLFEPFYGEVESVSWGIYRADGSVNPQTQLPMVQPTVDWVRLAQRFPVRIKPIKLPEGMQLRVGQTVSVLVDPIGGHAKAEQTAATTAGKFPKKLTDGRGATVRIDARPERIISLAPSTTQWLVELGAAGRLIGVTEHCVLPEGMDEVTRYAVYPAPSFEAIVGADADLIVTADIAGGKDVARLRELGQTVLVLNNDRYDGIVRDGETLGAAIGAEQRAAEISAKLRAEKESIEASTSDDDNSPTVLLALSPTLDYVAGPGSYADNLLQLAGGENIAADASSMWPKLSPEAIIGADPDVIIVTHSLADGADAARAEVLASFNAHPVWRKLTAVREGRVGVVDSQLMNVPGPKVGAALQALSGELHGLAE